MLVTGKDLESKLDELFAENTTDVAQVRGTKYELRLSGEYLIAPGPGRKPRFYTARRPLDGDLVLPPGGVAFVSTMERFEMPWGVVARTGVRYAMVRRGLVALVGSTVDPGYGMAPAAASEAGQPLYFLLANFSRTERRVQVGEGILTVEFERLEHEIEAAQQKQLEDALDRNRQTQKAIEDGQDLRVGLSFVTDLRDVEQRFEGLESWVERILILGLLVIMSALLALFADGLIHALTDGEFAKAVDHVHVIADHPLETLAVASLAIGPFVIATLALTWLVRFMRNRRQVARFSRVTS